MAVIGHKNETSIRSYSKTDICTKLSETVTIRSVVFVVSGVVGREFTQSSPVLNLSQEEVIINSSRSEITKNFNFFNCNVNTYSKLAVTKSGTGTQDVGSRGRRDVGLGDSSFKDIGTG